MWTDLLAIEVSSQGRATQTVLCLFSFLLVFFPSPFFPMFCLVTPAGIRYIALSRISSVMQVMHTAGELSIITRAKA